MANPLIEEWKAQRALKTAQPSRGSDLVAEWRASRQDKPIITSEFLPADEKKPFDVPRRDLGRDIAGYVHGRTLGIPKMVYDLNISPLGNAIKLASAATGHEAPEYPTGSRGGQLVGSLAGFTDLSKAVGKVPFLASRTVKTAGPIMGGVKKISNDLLQRGMRGAATGAIGMNTPFVTKLNEKPNVRAARTAAGAVIGGTTEALLPPVIETVSGKVPPFLRGIRRILNPTKKTFAETSGGRASQINAEKDAALLADKEMIGNELAPKAAEIKRQRILSMEPDALSQVGVKQGDINFAKKVKGLTSVKTIPTQEEGDAFYESVIRSIPEDTKIPTDNLRNALNKSISGAEGGLGKDPNLVNKLKEILSDLDRETTGASDSIMYGAGKRNLPITKQTYEATRRNLNRLFSDNPELNRFVQPLKEALDKDASLAAADVGVSAPMGRARLMYRLPRQLSKARTVVDNPNFNEVVEKEVREVANPLNVAKRENFRKLLGPEADDILAKLDSGKIAKEEADRLLAGLKERVSRQGYLTRKSMGAKTIAGNIGKGTVAVGGGYYTWKHLKEILDTLKGQQQYGNR